MPEHGIEVVENVREALSRTYPIGSRHPRAPRALLEVMVGGQPRLVDGRHFVQVTPVRLAVDPLQFAQLHRELFGDSTTCRRPPSVPPPRSPPADAAAPHALSSEDGAHQAAEPEGAEGGVAGARGRYSEADTTTDAVRLVAEGSKALATPRAGTALAAAVSALLEAAPVAVS